jgi:hypothetical protein
MNQRSRSRPAIKAGRSCWSRHGRTPDVETFHIGGLTCIP